MLIAVDTPPLEVPPRNRLSETSIEPPVERISRSPLATSPKSRLLTTNGENAESTTISSNHGLAFAAATAAAIDGWSAGTLMIAACTDPAAAARTAVNPSVRHKPSPLFEDDSIYDISLLEGGSDRAERQTPWADYQTRCIHTSVQTHLWRSFFLDDFSSGMLCP
jgi:hypothetical protein